MRTSQVRPRHHHAVTLFLACDSFTSARKHLRYWPLDIDIHNRKVAALRENVEERWTRYLRAMPMRRLATAASAAACERLWTRLSEEVERLLPPNASPTDEGGVLMSWTRGAHHVEIEVLPNGTYEWFYRHRPLDIAVGGLEDDDNVSNELIAHLQQ